MKRRIKFNRQKWPKPSGPLRVPAEPRRRKILISIVSGTGSPEGQTQAFCVNSGFEAEARGWEVAQSIRSADSMLVRARDVMLSAFYASDADEMLFLDDDVSAPPGMFGKLFSHERDKDGHAVELVAGVYPGRGDPIDFVVRPLSFANKPGPAEGGIERKGVYLDVQYPSGLAEVEGAATGFMRITRAGAQRMIEAHRDDWYEDGTAPGLRIYHLFDFVFRRERRQLFSEDYTFCERFRAAGGRVFVDVDLTLHHTGKKTFTGCFGDFLRGGGNARIPIVAQGAKPAAAPAPLGLIEAARSLLEQPA